MYSRRRRYKSSHLSALFCSSERKPLFCLPEYPSFSTFHHEVLCDGPGFGRYSLCQPYGPGSSRSYVHRVSRIKHLGDPDLTSHFYDSGRRKRVAEWSLQTHYLYLCSCQYRAGSSGMSISSSSSLKARCLIRIPQP